jgi:DNA-3-methyladenine glycosylase II
MLVRSILSQQLSSSAARTIKNRFDSLFLNGKFTARSVATLKAEKIRTAGVSLQKAQFIISLAENVLAGRTDFKALTTMSDEEVVSILTEIRGIGRWTAQMFLIFSLGRMNIFPDNDSGVKSAMRKLYGLDKGAEIKDFLSIAEAWRPFATAGSWYCWQGIDRGLLGSKPISGKRETA